MKHSPHVFSELEYESLPPALRRKYFSSLERLRLAKDGGVHPSPTPRTKSFRDIPRPSTLRKSSAPTQQTINSGSKRLRRPSTSSSTPVNADTAAWFASLPPAIRRKQFSKEEQILFASERHSVILDAADELFHRRCLEESPLDKPALPLTRPQTSYFPGHTDGISFLNDSDSESDIDPENPQECAETAVQEDSMANYSIGSFAFLNDDPALDLRLDDYHTAIAETALRQSTSHARPTSRRNLSLPALHLRRGSITSSSPNLHALNRAGPAQSRASLLPPLSPTRHMSTSSISSIDPRAAHYQDSAARMKLRVYLASPSKFDEAVEFGFPSLQDTARVPRESERLSTSPRTTNDSGRTFYTEDTPSLLGDDGSSNGEIDAPLDPRTPEDTQFRINRASQKNSNDRRSIKPHVVRHLTEPYAQSTTLDREMTIHMTLTRPDLRTRDAPAVSIVNSRPLEQSILPNLGKDISIWDTLPDDKSTVKRIWRRLKMR